MADINFRSSSFGDEFDAEVLEIATRREVNFGLRYGMNVTERARQAADESHSKDIDRMRVIVGIRTARTVVSCDDNCGALDAPGEDVEELKKTLEHYKSHSYLGGCSHGGV